jgi:hypothetical protein
MLLGCAVQNFFNRPLMVCQSRRLRWRETECAMNTTKIEVRHK